MSYSDRSPRLHVLGVALIGCLVLALLTGEHLWGWIGLLGALVVGFSRGSSPLP